MQCLIDLAYGSFPNFWVVMCHRIDVIVYYVIGHDQVVIPSSGGLHALLMQQLHCTPLTAHSGVQKTADLLFAHAW